MKTKCVGSDISKEKLEDGINKYFYSTGYIITEDNKVYNTLKKKYLDRYIVVVKGGRWQFREITETKNN